MLDFKSSDPIFLKRPDIEKELWLKFEHSIDWKEDYVYIMTSGTTASFVKLLEISKQKILGHAKLINQCFDINKKSRLLLSLPDFYMGGFSIITRAFVANSKLFYSEKFDIKSIVELVNEKKITHLSLVPTQVYDYFKSDLSFNNSLEVIFVGGDRISAKLKEKMIESGLPFFHTYGASEFCSQVATSSIKSPLSLLPSIEARTVNGLVSVKSPFHFERVFSLNNAIEITTYKDSLVDGFYMTNDIGNVEDRKITVKGRSDDIVKINGKMTNLIELESKIIAPDGVNFFITHEKDPRKGSQIVLVTSNEEDFFKINYPWISKVYNVSQILKTSSGKTIKKLSKYQSLIRSSKESH